jgi:hypothetical protein
VGFSHAGGSQGAFRWLDISCTRCAVSGWNRAISGNHRDALNSALPYRHCWRKWAAEPERLSGQVWGRKIPGPVRRSSARKRGISRHGAAVSLLRQRELAWIVPKILPAASRSQDSWIRLVLPPQSSQAFPGTGAEASLARVQLATSIGCIRVCVGSGEAYKALPVKLTSGQRRARSRPSTACGDRLQARRPRRTCSRDRPARLAFPVLAWLGHDPLQLSRATGEPRLVRTGAQPPSPA